MRVRTCLCLAILALLVPAEALAQDPAPTPAPDAAAASDTPATDAADAAAGTETGAGDAGPEPDALAPLPPDAAPREAEVPPPLPPDAAEAPAATDDSLPQSLTAALKAWREAQDKHPSIVSLGKLDDLGASGDQLAKILKERLVLLGRKTFSNREWKAYWEEQKRTVEPLAREWRALGTPTGARIADGLGAWAALAADKIANQDDYLRAVESERDAVEERLEAILDLATDVEQDKKAAEAAAQPKHERKTAHDKRDERIGELDRRLELQKEKRALAEQEIKLIDLQLKAQAELRRALQVDAELAEREFAIARGQAQVEDEGWAALWKGVAADARDKVLKLRGERELGDDRERALQVEKGLAESQIAYRTEKAAKIEAQLEEATSVGGWFEATWDTLLDWLVHDGWRVALALVLIWFLLRIALRAIKVLTRAVLKAVEDDDPDDVSQAEQRAQTIAAVFKGIAVVGVYAVAVLLALEQVGVNTAPLLGSVAILGLAVSFGAQNLVRDVVNGFFILIENQYAVGDVVTIGGVTGTVEKINVRSTRVREFNGTLHVIPNGAITSAANVTRDWSRVVLDLGVSYDADLELAKRLINDVGAEIYAEPEWAKKFLEAPSCMGIMGLEDSFVTLRMVAKTEPGDHWAAGRELRRRMKAAFDEHGVEIPFPQRVVWHRAEPGQPLPPEAGEKSA